MKNNVVVTEPVTPWRCPTCNTLLGVINCQDCVVAVSVATCRLEVARAKGECPTCGRMCQWVKPSKN